METEQFKSRSFYFPDEKRTPGTPAIAWLESAAGCVEIRVHIFDRGVTNFYGGLGELD
jgi:hypothetical protein